MSTIERFSGKYHFLSNFYQTPVTWEGQKYQTTEHAFQAAKTLDEEERAKIRKAPSPSKAKALGRKVKMRPDWASARVDVMHKLLRLKFAKDPLRQELLDTGDAKLIEGNSWHDIFWGVCDGRGKNMLGKLLMLVRAELTK